MSAGEDPLVVTLALDDESARRLDDLRREHFPAARNVLAAHVTLFHALPGRCADVVLDVLGACARRPPFRVGVAAPRSLGRGVALDLTTPDGDALRARALRDLTAALADRGEELTRQDAQRARLHVTVANRLEPAAVRALLARLAAEHAPWSADAVGLDVWHYRGGPWEPLARVPLGPVGSAVVGSPPGRTRATRTKEHP